MGKEKKKYSGKGKLRKRRADEEKRRRSLGGNSTKNNGRSKRKGEGRRKKIEESKYNEVYKYIVREEKPEYLRGKMKKKDKNIIARYRCGNETKGGQYWREEGERRCRICAKDEGSIIYVLRECREIKEELTVKEFLKADGRGLEVMKKIDNIRREKRKEEERLRESNKEEE